jgi:23S rRNA pseudouridine1911/1915/1917 synthase
MNPANTPDGDTPEDDDGIELQEAAVPLELAGKRFDQALAEMFPEFSRSRLAEWIKAGDALLDGQSVRPRDPVRGGETVTVSLRTSVETHSEAEAIPIDIRYQDADVLVVDKPAGLVVHPAAGNIDGTLVNALLHHCGGSLSGIGGVARPGIVHRIDKDTSGLLVVAKHDKAHEGLAKQFADHSIDRRYLAIVSGVPRLTGDVVDAPLARSPQNRKKIAIVKEGRGKRAVTHWKRVQILKDSALVECRLETGRTHQVRVHMASIGHPLLGDPVYGRGKSVHRDLLNQLDFKRQALHAAHLGFIHPVTKGRLSFDSALPSDMQELFTALGV